MGGKSRPDTLWHSEAEVNSDFRSTSRSHGPNSVIYSLRSGLLLCRNSSFGVVIVSRAGRELVALVTSNGQFDRFRQAYLTFPARKVWRLSARPRT